MKIRKSLKIAGTVLIAAAFLIAWICLRDRGVHQQSVQAPQIPQSEPVVEEEPITPAPAVVKVESPAEIKPVVVADANAPAPETEEALAQFGLSATMVIGMDVKEKVMHPVIIGRQQ